MQVVLSIHKGKLLPSWLLQKLNTDSPKNKLYLAFRELGRVIRTVFLLEFVSNTDAQRSTSGHDKDRGLSGLLAVDNFWR